MAHVQLTGHKGGVESTVDSFIANLPELLGELLVDHRCIVAVAEFADGRYVQFRLDSPNYFIGEVISNHYISDLRALSNSDEEELERMGWNRSQVPGRPNWFRFGSSIGNLIEVIDLTRRAVYDVLAEKPSNVVLVRTFEVTRKSSAVPRGHEEPIRVRELEFD
jgi:hypothetical protein